MLTPLQLRLAGVVTALPEAGGFALAGAGGLLVHGLIDRATRDLDYFAAPGEEAAVVDLRDALESALDDAGLTHRRQRDLLTFVCIEVGDGDDRWRSIWPSTTGRCRYKPVDTVRHWR